MSESEIKAASIKLAAKLETTYEKAEALVRRAVKEQWKSL